MSVFDRIQALVKHKSAAKTPKRKRVNIGKRFEFLREAISGTMSNFYMARDFETNEIVGLKIGDREKVAFFESRFRGLNKPSEGEIAKSLQDETIVITREHGLTTTGVPFLVMDFLEGNGLHVLLNNRDSVIEGKRVSMLQQMARALSAVHKANFIHRDICPRNYICGPGCESVKLIDFGLTLPAKREFMQPGNRTGTPIYMAPEVVRRRWTDHRLDIFSFGVTAFQLCTFQLPWPSEDKSGMAALAHDTRPPDDIMNIRPELNPVLGKAIMKCIESNPDHRPQTMEQVLGELSQVKTEFS